MINNVKEQTSYFKAFFVGYLSDDLYLRDGMHVEE